MHTCIHNKIVSLWASCLSYICNVSCSTSNNQKFTFNETKTIILGYMNLYWQKLQWIDYEDDLWGVYNRIEMQVSSCFEYSEVKYCCYFGMYWRRAQEFCIKSNTDLRYQISFIPNRAIVLSVIQSKWSQHAICQVWQHRACNF